ncbi:MAG: hypothetical protein RBQ99_07565 [Trichlorobacter sp.]|nr:hypothetical protein [Trichlorobacter sp.]
MKIAHGTINQATTPPPFDSTHWQQTISKMVAGFYHRDPRAGCWQWIQTNRPDLWQEQMTANKEIDQAYQQQDTWKIEQAVSKAQDSFNAMLQAWEKRNQFIQPSLMAA